MSFEEALRVISSLLEQESRLGSRGSMELALRHPDTKQALGIACEALRIVSARKEESAPRVNIKSGQFWRTDDEKRLIGLVKDGLGVSEIAKELGRSLSSVRSRITKLGLTDEVGSAENS